MDVMLDVEKLTPQIEWLKLYAFENKIDFDFLQSGKPVSKNHFADIDPDIRLGFTIEEGKIMPENEPCFVRHMSLTFFNKTVSDIPPIKYNLFILLKFGFTQASPIRTYSQVSDKNEAIIVHFLQAIENNFL